MDVTDGERGVGPSVFLFRSFWYDPSLLGFPNSRRTLAGIEKPIEIQKIKKNCDKIGIFGQPHGVS